MVLSLETPKSDLKMSSSGDLISNWKSRSQTGKADLKPKKKRSQQSASSLSLLVMPQHIGINKMLSNPFGKSEILRKSAVKQFVIL